MSSILSIGATGLQQAERRFEAAAGRIVESGAQSDAAPAGTAPEVDLAVEMVSLSLGSYDFKAAAKIVQVGRDMGRSLVDILA
ncbi:MAG: hypothetical protein ABIQ30_06375 [Devosia sp.]